MSSYKIGVCTWCSKQDVIVAKGLCRACYNRARKHGTPIYTKIRGQCTVDGCTDPHVARGLCNKHYVSVQRHGSLTSSFNYGNRRKHPLYDAWRQQTRCSAGREKDWDDFWAFVGFAKERPSKNHIQKRYKELLPWGPSNFYWYEKLGENLVANDHQKNWRNANKLKAKSYALKSSYGITLQIYDEMYLAQKGLCKICLEQKNSYTDECGRTATLHVDHNHDTGKVRGLLCHKCNIALGGFNDSIDLLEKASIYLRRYSKE